MTQPPSGIPPRGGTLPKGAPPKSAAPQGPPPQGPPPNVNPPGNPPKGPVSPNDLNPSLPELGELKIPHTPRQPLDWHDPDYRGTRRPTGGSSGRSRSSSRSSSRGGSSGGSSKGGSSRNKRGKKNKKTQHHWYRPRNVVLTAIGLVALLVLGYLFALNAQLNAVRRAPLLADFDGPASIGTNVLLIESDQATGEIRPDKRTLVVQLIHLSADRRQAAVVHLPRDLLVKIPGLPKKAPAAALQVAYQRGGAPLLTETLQRLLQLRVDHVIEVGLPGYHAVTDRIGGVTMTTAVRGVVAVRTLTGAQAAAYVDNRNNLTQGDVETGRRHQEWEKAMLRGSLMPGVLLNPLKVFGLVHDLTHNLVVDETFTTREMRSMTWSVRYLRPSTIRYLTAPFTRYVNRPGVGHVLLPDAPGLVGLGQALASDNPGAIAEYDN